MEYEQFFDTSKLQHEVDFKLTLIGISFTILLFDCISSCRMRNRVNELKEENMTLKRIITNAIGEKLTKMLKNGYELNDSDDE